MHQIEFYRKPAETSNLLYLLLSAAANVTLRWSSIVEKGVFISSVPNTTGLRTHTSTRSPKVGFEAVIHAFPPVELQGSWCSCTNYGLISEFGHGWPSWPVSVNPPLCCNHDFVGKSSASSLQVCPGLIFFTLALPSYQLVGCSVMSSAMWRCSFYSPQIESVDPWYCRWKT